MVKIYCDYCGKEISETVKQSNRLMLLPYTGEMPAIATMDLHQQGCWDQFIDAVKNLKKQEDIAGRF